MKKTLILDLDETLVFSEHEKTQDSYDLQFKIDGISFNTIYRPHLKAFLDFANQHYEIFIWTSASDDYAKIICDEIFQNIPYTLLARKFSDVRVPMYDHFFEDLPHLAKVSRVIRSQKFWRKNLPEIGNQGYISIKPLDLFLKAYPHINKKDIICIDNDPYKFENSYGNFWAIRDFMGKSDDADLLKFITLLDQLKDLTDVRVPKQDIIKKLGLLGF